MMTILHCIYRFIEVVGDQRCPVCGVSLGKLRCCTRFHRCCFAAWIVWSSTVTMYDASMVRFGIVESEADASEIGTVGRNRERLRFR